MGTQRVQSKGVLSWLIRWIRHAGTRDLYKLYPALAALISPVQILFSLPYTILTINVPLFKKLRDIIFFVGQ
jgi:hypothetical protein